MKFPGHLMRKEGLEIMILIRKIKGKKDKGKQCMTHLTSFDKCIAKQSLWAIANRQNFLSAAK